MPHVPALDGLRAIAVLLVVVFHSSRDFSSAGFLGVDVFFVLSGYLITSLLVLEWRKTGRVDYGRFMVRRLRRLVPALVAMLALFALSSPFLFPDADLISELGFSGLYISNFSRQFAETPEYTQHTWSLAQEMQFYLIWPLLLPLLLPTSAKKRLMVLAMWYGAMTILRISGYTPSTEEWTYYSFFDRSTGMLLGAILAFVPVSSFSPVLLRWMGPAGLAVILGLAFSNLSFFSFTAASLGIPAAEFASAAVILSVSSRQGLAHDLLAWRPMVAIGSLSYGIYIYHYPLVRLMRDALPDWQILTIALGGSTGLALLSYHLIEKRFYRPSQNTPQNRPNTQPQHTPAQQLSTT